MNITFPNKSVIVTGAMVLTFCALALVMPATAQDVPALPLIISRFNDPVLYRYEGGEVEPMTYCQPEGEMFVGSRSIALAPDGMRFAFLARSSLLPEGYNGPSLGFTDIWICDVAGRSVTQIAGQPDDAAIVIGNLGDSVYTIHSLPSWSPDGTQLTWNQITAPGTTLETVVYSASNGETRTVYERVTETTMPARALMPAGIEWGEGGIALYDMVDSQIYLQSVTLIDPDKRSGGVVELNGSVPASIMRWAQDGQQSLFVLARIDATLVAVDPVSAEVVEIPASNLEYYSLFAPETSLRIFGYEVDYNVWEWSVAGDTANSSFQYPLGIQGTIDTVALSPNGQQVAFITFENPPLGGKVYITSNVAPDHAESDLQRIEALDAYYGEPGAQYVYWSPLGLRISS